MHRIIPSTDEISVIPDKTRPAETLLKLRTIYLISAAWGIMKHIANGGEYGFISASDATGIAWADI